MESQSASPSIIEDQKRRNQSVQVAPLKVLDLNSGEAFKEGFRSLVFMDVGLDGVSEGGDVCEVGDAIVFLVSDGEGN